MRTGRRPVEILRLAVYVSLVLLAMVVSDGRACFGIAIGGTILALVLLLLDRPEFFRLSMLWHLAFLLIVCVDGYSNADLLGNHYGSWAYDEAAQYLLGANSMVLFGHALVFRERSVPPVREPSPAIGRSRLPVAIISVAYVVFLIHTIPDTVRAWRFGRVAFEPTIGALAVFGGFALACGLILPSLIAFYGSRVRRWRLRTMFLFSLPVFASQAVIGTRFTLLISFVGFFVVCIAPRRLSMRSLALVGGAGLVLIATSAIMQQSRAFGLGRADVGENLESFEARSIASTEGVVDRLSMIVKYAYNHDLLYGTSSAAVLVFWIPRTVWRDKPTLLGYWLPRAVGVERLSATHSVSYSFAGDAYLDFGKYGGWLFMLGLGLLFGLLERWTARVLTTAAHPMIPVAASLYGASFFAVRSLNTTLISLSGVVLLGLFFRAALRAHPSARLPRRYVAP